MIDHLLSHLSRDISRILKSLYGDDLLSSIGGADVTQSTQDQFGHYQLNSAMKLGKQLKQNPQAVAKNLVSQIALLEYVEKAEVAGPGFINITLSK
jgi:arginyl-tRNA synthetase